MAGTENDPKDGEPKYVTAQEVADMVTGAVRSNLKKELGKELTSALEGLKLDEKIAEAIKTLAPKPADPPKPDDKAKADPQLIAMQEKITALETANKASEAARLAAEQKSRDQGARSSLKSYLAEHVTPGSVDMVTKLLFDADKRVGFDDDGTPFFKIRKSPGQGLPEEDMQYPLTDGVGQWLKSEEAKLFLPPPDAKGEAKRGSLPQRSLARGADGMPRYESPPQNDDERARRATEKESALKARLGI